MQHTQKIRRTAAFIILTHSLISTNGIRDKRSHNRGTLSGNRWSKRNPSAVPYPHFHARAHP